MSAPGLLSLLPFGLVTLADEPARTAITLRSRTVQTTKTHDLLDATPWHDRVHLLAKLSSSHDVRLSEARTVSALGGRGFVVSLDEDRLVEARDGGPLPRGVAWLGEIQPRDRTDPALWPALDGRADEPRALHLRPFRDVDIGAFEEALTIHAPEARCDPLRLCVLEADGRTLRDLAGWDPVAWIEPDPGPPVPTLDGVARALGVDEVRPATGDPPQYDLSGRGVVAALFDPDCVDADHPDLAGRVLRDASGSGCSHATQCGGALGGSGAGTREVYADWEAYRWTGMAPEVEIAFYQTSSSAVITLGSQIVNSVEEYGAMLGSFSFRQGTGGDYNSDAASLDFYLHNGEGDLPWAMPFFWATANEASAEGYHSLADYVSAKNVIAVGATNANDDSLADFSSMGPTADGRLKPDVMAPGCYDTMNVDVEVDEVRVLGDGEEALAWRFDTDGDAEGWAAMNDLEGFDVSDGLLQTTVTGRDPYMHGPEVSEDSALLDTVELSFSASTVTLGQIFWQNSGGGWDEERHLDFFMPGTGEIETVDVDVSSHENWAGTFTQLRFDPAVLGVTVPDEGPTYVANCGTSLAAPAVAGVAALMLEAWFDNHAGEDHGPIPAVYRALLTATATDMVGEGDGTNPDLGGPTPYAEGPDYATGWGLVHAPGAVAGFGEHRAEDPRYLVDEVTAEEPIWSAEVDVPSGGAELRVMLAWDDLPGESMAEPVLQNDLDLVLLGPEGTTWEPWILDPDEPTAAASTGTNTLDNLEGVSVWAPAAGIYTVQVTASRLVDSAQAFALVAIMDGWALPLPAQATSDTGLDSSPPGETGDTGTEKPGGCGCTSSAPRAAFWFLLPLAIIPTRRRSRA